MNPVTAGNYASVVSQRVASERLTLAGRWLSRLNELLVVQPNELGEDQLSFS